MKFNLKYAAKLTFHFAQWSWDIGWAGGTAPKYSLVCVGPAVIPVKVLTIGISIDLGFDAGFGEGVDE